MPPKCRRSPSRNLGTLQHFASDEVLCWEGDPGGGCLRLNGGVLRAVRYTEDGARQVLGFFWPTEMLCLSERETSHCTIEAVIDCQIVSLPFDGHSDVGLHKVLMEKVIATLAVVGCKSVMSRIAWFLLELQRRDNGADGLIGFDYPRADLADYLGTRTETVCRTLAEFRDRGLIEPFEPRRLRILDARGLATLAHDRLTD
ncbi:MAG: Crp/Fnr family transcriptional regulator [Magnetospirillum sp.]|nr:Crp/Fnr family transcriptional regulator [Magnetospirillum sp.]